MVNIENAKASAADMQKKAETIVKACAVIEMLENAKRMLHKEKSGISLDAGGKTLRLMDISEIINTTIKDATEKQINAMIKENEQCISELLGNIEPLKKKRKP